MIAERGVARFSLLLVVRGGLLLLAGALAARWPDEVISPAMTWAALLLVVAGAYELALAWRYWDRIRAWPVAAADGMASIGYGALTAAVTVVPVRLTSLLVAAWLTAYAIMLVGLALGLWPMHRTRQLLLLTGGAMLLIAALAVADRAMTLVTLVYAGAGFAAALGAFQVAAGLWMRRVALPYFTPTTQSRWSGLGHTPPQRRGAAIGSARPARAGAR